MTQFRVLRTFRERGLIRGDTHRSDIPKMWLGALFYRIARGGERIVVAGWLADIVLGPVKILFSPTGALVIRYLQTATMGAAFLAALVLIRKNGIFGVWLFEAGHVLVKCGVRC